MDIFTVTFWIIFIFSAIFILGFIAVLAEFFADLFGFNRPVSKKTLKAVKQYRKQHD